jgi:hypothetical protein
MRSVLLLALALLSGCSITDRFLSSAEKFNQAFPPASEVRVLIEDAREALKSEPGALDALDERVRSQIQLRSLTCIQGLSIGRLDSVEKIRELPVKKECLEEQDELLAAAVATFRLGQLLALPPLRPLASLDGAPAVPKMGGGEAYSFHAAAEANVMLVRGTRSGEFSAVEIPSGKLLATMPTLQVGAHPPILSANGRLAALSLGAQGVVFLDLEHGKKLWETKKLSQFFAWLPDVGAVLVRDVRSGSPVLLDLETGRQDTYAAGPKAMSWVTPTAEKGTVWLGSAREVFRVEHVRTPNGLQATVTKDFRLSQTQGVTSHPPTMMNHGKTLFFVSNRDFGSLNLETGEETVWNVTDFLAPRYAKLSETTLLVDSYLATGGAGMKTWLMDLEARTLAAVDPVTSSAARSGLLMELTGRTGWIRRGSDSTYLGNIVLADAPQSLDELSGAFNLERQLAKMEMLERQEVEMAERERLTGRPEGGRYRPVGSSPRGFANGSSAAVAAPPSAPQAGLPRDAQVEAVGVYQGRGSSGGVASDGRKMGTVSVRVRRGSAPVILVLASYEPVQWTLTVDPGAQLAGILLSGYYPSRVTGNASARVLQMGRTYAYQRGTREYEALDREVRTWTGGQGIKVFQGRYEGGEYTVGG